MLSLGLDLLGLDSIRSLWMFITLFYVALFTLLFASFCDFCVLTGMMDM